MRAMAVQSPADDMARKERQLVLRLDAELSERLDAYMATLKAAAQGAEIPLSGVVRGLIARGLDGAEAELPRPPGPRAVPTPKKR